MHETVPLISGKYTLKDLANMVMLGWDKPECVEGALWILEQSEKDSDTLRKMGFMVSGFPSMGKHKNVATYVTECMTWAETPKGMQFWQDIYNYTSQFKLNN